MVFPLTKKDSESYFKALKLMTSAGIEDVDKVRSSKSTYAIINMLLGQMALDVENPVTINNPLCIKAKESLMILLKKVKQLIADENVQQQNVTGKNKKSNNNKIKGCQEVGKYKKELQRLEAVIHLHLGKILWRSEDLKNGEKELLKCWLVLQADDKDNLIIQAKQHVLNEFGLLSIEKGNLEKSVKYFEESKKLYENFKDLPSPWCVNDFFRVEAYNPHFKNDQKRTHDFITKFTQTLFFLAIRYWNMGPKKEAASCFRNILSTQLDNHSYNAYDWARVAAMFSQFYTFKRDFKMARHCLAAAETVLKQEADCPSNLFVMLPKGLSKEQQDDKRKVSEEWAHLYYLWAKYCISLLILSGKKPSDLPTVKDEFSFQLDVTECESQVRAEKVVSLKEANEVFLKALAWMNRSKEFYHLEGYCTHCVDMVIDNSDLIKALCFFGPDGNIAYKILKSQIDMLTELLNQVNQKLYLSLPPRICFELGLCYSTMTSVKCLIFEKHPANQHPFTLAKTNSAEEINSVAQKSIEFSERYLDYFRNSSGKLPETLEEEHDLKVINAHSFIAKMYTQIKTEHHQELLLNYTKAIKYYSYIVEYLHKHPLMAIKYDLEMDSEMGEQSVSEIYKLSAKILEIMARQ